MNDEDLVLRGRRIEVMLTATLALVAPLSTYRFHIVDFAMSWLLYWAMANAVTSRAGRALSGLAAVVAVLVNPWAVIVVGAMFVLGRFRQLGEPCQRAFFGVAPVMMVALAARSSVGGYGLAGLSAVVIALLIAGCREIRHRTDDWRARRLVTVLALGCMAGVGSFVTLAAVSARSAQQLVSQASGVSLQSATSGELLADLDTLATSIRRVPVAHSTMLYWLARLVPYLGSDLGRGRRGLNDAARILTELADITRSLPETGGDASGHRPGLRELNRRLVQLDGNVSTSVDNVGRIHLGMLPDRRRASAERLRDSARGFATRFSGAVSTLGMLPDVIESPVPKHYFVMFSTPSQSRDLGGFMGNWAIIDIGRGSIGITRMGRTAELIVRPPGQPQLGDGVTRDERSALPPSFANDNPGFDVRGLTNTVDLPAILPTVVATVERVTGQRIDGVIYADPDAVAAVVGTTTPISVANVPYHLTGVTTRQYLLHDQYEIFDGDVPARTAVLEDLSREMMARIDTIPPTKLLLSLVEPLFRRHVAIAALDPALADGLRRAGIDGALPDYSRFAIGVLNANADANKIDFFLRRKTEIVVAGDIRKRSAQAQLTVTLYNSAPTGDPSYLLGGYRGKAPGFNTTRLSILSSTRPFNVRVDGVLVPTSYVTERELVRTMMIVSLPASSEAVVTAELVVPRQDVASIAWIRQPLPQPDAVETRFTA